MTHTIQVIRKKGKKVGRDSSKNLEVLWTIGHGLTIVCGLLFTLTYFYHVLFFFKYRNWKWLFLRENKHYSFIHGTRWYHYLIRWTPQILFRLSLCGVFITNCITMKQNWSGLKPTWYDLLSAENFQAMLIAALWFVGGGKSFYKLLPFMGLSFLHLKNKKYEFTIQDEADAKDKEFSVKHRHLLHWIAYSEVFIVVTLLLDSLLMKNGTSGFMLVIYSSIYWLRLNFSPYAQVTILRILAKFDKKIPPKHKEKWDTIKRFIYAKIREREMRKETAEKTA